MVYRERVNGVVLIASTNTVGTGVVVSGQGDIVTNEHIVQDVHKARGEEWVAVWFKPSKGVRPAKRSFLLAKVLQRNQRRDLAHIRLAQLMPQTATVIPLASLMPNVIRRPTSGPSARAWCPRFDRTMSGDTKTGSRGARPRFRRKPPVNPGNSGGPLLNEEGAVVGIVVGSATETEGVYFAVSVQHVRELLPGEAEPRTPPSR